MLSVPWLANGTTRRPGLYGEEDRQRVVLEWMPVRVVWWVGCGSVVLPS